MGCVSATIVPAARLVRHALQLVQRLLAQSGRDPPCEAPSRVSIVEPPQESARRQIEAGGINHTSATLWTSKPFDQRCVQGAAAMLMYNAEQQQRQIPGADGWQGELGSARGARQCEGSWITTSATLAAAPSTSSIEASSASCTLMPVATTACSCNTPLKQFTA